MLNLCLPSRGGFRKAVSDTTHEIPVFSLRFDGIFRCVRGVRPREFYAKFELSAFELVWI